MLNGQSNMAPSTQTPRPNMFGTQLQGVTQMRRAIPVTPAINCRTNRALFAGALPSINEHADLVTSIVINPLTDALVVEISFENQAGRSIAFVQSTPAQHIEPVMSCDVTPISSSYSDIDDSMWSFGSPKAASSRCRLSLDVHDLPMIDDDLNEEQNQEIEQIIMNLLSNEFRSSDKSLMHNLLSRVPAYVSKIKSSNEWDAYSQSSFDLNFHMSGHLEQLQKKLTNDKHYKKVVSFARSILIADHQLAVQNAQKRIEEQEQVIAEKDQKIVDVFEENGHLLCRIGKLIETTESEAQEHSSFKAKSEATEKELVAAITQLSEEKTDLHQRINLLVKSVDLSVQDASDNQTKLNQVSEHLEAEQKRNSVVVADLEASQQYVTHIDQLNQSSQVIIADLHNQVSTLQQTIVDVNTESEMNITAHRDALDYFQSKLEQSIDQTVYQATTISTLQLDSANKQCQLDSINQSMSQLDSENESLRYTVASTAQNIEQLRQELSVSEDLVGLFTARCVESQDTVLHLTQSLDSMTCSKNQQISQLEHELVSIKQSSASQVEDLDNQVQSLRSELQSAHHQHAQEIEMLKHSMMSDIEIVKQQSINQLAAQQAISRSILVQLHHARQTVIDHDQQTAAKIGDLINQSFTHSETIQQLKSENYNLSHSIDQLTADKSGLHQQINDLKQNIKDLQSSFDSERESINQSNSQLVMSVQTERDQLSESISQLQQSWDAERQSHNQSVNQLKSELRAQIETNEEMSSNFADERQSINQSIDELNFTLDTEREQHSNTVKSINQSINQLDQELTEAKHQIADLETDMSTRETSSNQSINQLESQLAVEHQLSAKLTLQMSTLSQELESATSQSINQSNEIKSLKADVNIQAAQLIKLLHDSSERVNQLEQKHRAELDLLTTQLTESRKTFATLNEQSINQIKLNEQSINQSISQLNKERELHEKDVTKLSDTIAELSAQLNDRNVQIVQLTDEKNRAIASLRHEKEEKERINQSINQSNKQAQSQINAVQRSVSVPLTQSIKQSTTEVVVLISDEEEDYDENQLIIQPINQSVSQTAEEAHEDEQNNLRRSARLRKSTTQSVNQSTKPVTRQSRALVDRTNQSINQPINQSIKLSKHTRSQSAVVSKTRSKAAVSFAPENSLQVLIDE